MFELVRTVNCKDLDTCELQEFLDSYFHPELASGDGARLAGDSTLSEGESQQLWAEEFIRRVPERAHEKLFYISQSTNTYHNQNLVGRVCLKYVWREFFKAFPLGCIMLVDLSREWFTSLWQGMRDFSEQMGFSPDDPMAVPQGMSGLQAENFPLNVLLVGASGIYPLTLYDFIQTSSDLVFVYVSDSTVVHAQMLETGAYSRVLWRLHHIFDDQWTFDSFRGPKSGASDTEMNPIKCFDYFTWLIKRINDRMDDVLSIPDPLRREQICMTFTRAVCDCVLSVTAQLPYMAKVFFFACLDKLSNLYWQLGHRPSELDAWHALTDPSFLCTELAAFLRCIPKPVGNYLQGIVDLSVENMRIDNITPDVLRDIRNSHHGYKLKPEIVARLFASSGELNNDTTLLVTPLVLYLLGEKWS